MLETVSGAVRRLSKISICAFECDYYYCSPTSISAFSVPLAVTSYKASTKSNSVRFIFFYTSQIKMVKFDVVLYGKTNQFKDVNTVVSCCLSCSSGNYKWWCKDYTHACAHNAVDVFTLI